MVSIGAEWRARNRVSAGVALGGSGGAIDIEDDSRSWSAGSFTRIDVMATFAADAGRFTGRVSAGPTWMRGPDDVMPFRGDGGGFAMHWGGDASIEIALDAARRFRLRIGMDAARLNPGGTTPAPEPGTFTRFHFGVVHAR